MTSNEIRIDIDIPLQHAYNYQIVSSLLTCFTLHIIYMRCLIPQPFNVISGEVYSRSLDPKKLSSIEKKTVMFVNQMTLLIESLQQYTKHFKLSTFCLLIGPSANNAKESYTLHFNNVVSDEDFDSDCQISDKLIAKYKRQLLHRLIEYQSNDVLKPAMKTNIFVALEVSSVVKGVDTGCANHDTPLITDILRNNYVYREKFKIKVKKRGPRPLHIFVNGIPPVKSNEEDENMSLISQQMDSILNLNADDEFECIPTIDASDQHKLQQSGDDEAVMGEVEDDDDELVDMEHDVEDAGENEGNQNDLRWFVLKKGIKSLKNVISSSA